MNSAIADRMSLIDSSGIRKVFALASKLKDPVNLSIGQPHFDVSEEVKKTAIQAIQNGLNKYTLTQGIPELREKIKVQQEKKNISLEEIMITSGVSGGLMLAFMCLINPGDEVIVPDPYFVMYKHLIKVMGGIPVFVDTYPSFDIPIDKVEQAISKKTKIIVINSPCNPTGAVYSKDQLKNLADIAAKHNILIISDEIYNEFIYEEESVSIAEIYENTLVLNGFSKTYAMTGWRLGWAGGPKWLLDEMIKLQQYTFVCAPSIVQYSGLKAMDYNVAHLIDSYKEKRDIMYNGLKDYFDILKPEGAFYMFVKTPDGLTDEEFVGKAIDNNLLIIPGNVFSEKKTHFRLCYAAENEVLYKGIEILQNLSGK
ncbi:aminotransferase class I/II-fold pyridoxal phosphate-dependent enzyme [bacterium]|nr:aminotransferase class I/II-fold pyridoxal phosphate-dependent enzyme [bacterium]